MENLSVTKPIKNTKTASSNSPLIFKLPVDAWFEICTYLHFEEWFQLRFCGLEWFVCREPRFRILYGPIDNEFAYDVYLRSGVCSSKGIYLHYLLRPPSVPAVCGMCGESHETKLGTFIACSSKIDEYIVFVCNRCYTDTKYWRDILKLSYGDLHNVSEKFKELFVVERRGKNFVVYPKGVRDDRIFKKYIVQRPLFSISFASF